LSGDSTTLSVGPLLASSKSRLNNEFGLRVYVAATSPDIKIVAKITF